MARKPGQDFLVETVESYKQQRRYDIIVGGGRRGIRYGTFEGQMLPAKPKQHFEY